MKISIEASLNRDCRNTRRANICLYSRMLRSSNFQSASTFVGATWLRIYRSRVRVFVPCTCQRLTDFQRTLLTGSTGGETSTLSTSLQPFSTSKKNFFIRQARTILPRIGLCVRAIRLFYHCNYLPNSSHANSNYPL